MLNKEKIIEEFNKINMPLPKIFYYDLTDSTNTRAKEYAKENPNNRETVIFIANEQSAGRGRRGRSFVSNPGSGIYMSILTYPDKKGADATRATARAAVSLARSVEAICGYQTNIKWVNDLYLGGKKLAGILTEGEMDENGKIAYQVVGMGINVYKSAISDQIADIATSLEGELNCAPDRSKLAAKIIYEFLCGNADYYEDYKSRSFIIGKEITVIKLSESYQAKVIDIDSDYSLIVDRNGKTERLFTGEISLKL